MVAVCDVDLANADRASELLGGKPEVYQDYRKLLDRKDVEIVTNGTPDHWHTAVNVAACRAGKDVYTEKPLTLTIDEGKLLRKVVEETGRIVQVGTQQRSEAHFRTACELVRNGRVGKLREVRVYLPFWTTKGGPFAARPVPSTLDWDLWQGQAPEHPFCPERLTSSSAGGATMPAESSPTGASTTWTLPTGAWAWSSQVHSGSRPRASFPTRVSRTATTTPTDSWCG